MRGVFSDVGATLRGRQSQIIKRRKGVPTTLVQENFSLSRSWTAYEGLSLHRGILSGSKWLWGALIWPPSDIALLSGDHLASWTAVVYPPFFFARVNQPERAGEGFTAIARRMRESYSAVSRRVGAVEKRLAADRRFRIRIERVRDGKFKT